MAEPWGTRFQGVSRCTMNNNDITDEGLGPAEPIPFIWIDTDDRLRQCVDAWVKLPYIILDTEFERSNTYYAKAGLIQVSAKGQTYLIDPLSLSSLKPLGEVLECETVEIVLHSMSEDIDLLSHICDCHISSVFDTQIANAFLGQGVSVGYQRLVEMVLGVALDKGETRSDWLRRPLSKKQLHYAAADVHYLDDIYLRLRSALQATPWLDAVLEECAKQVSMIESAGTNPEQAYLKLRGAWDLSLPQQVILSALVQWRDQNAIGHDVPKGWVFSDPQLIEIARLNPTTQGALFALPKIKPKSVKRFGAELLDFLASLSDAVPTDFIPVDRPIKGKELEFYKRIKSLVTKTGEAKGLDPQLIAGRKQMEAWVIHYWRNRIAELPEGMQGWRSDLIGDDLSALAQQTCFS